jgi:hypothetical protein
MKQLLRMALSRPIVANALRVSLVVGLILNAINQGSAIVHAEAISWFHIALNFLVPYCVASYSGARALLKRGRQDRPG